MTSVYFYSLLHIPPHSIYAVEGTSVFQVILFCIYIYKNTKLHREKSRIERSTTNERSG